MGRAQICHGKKWQPSSDRSQVGMAKNILITGGAGFVGSHLADALLAAGPHARLFDTLTGQVHLNGIPESLAEDAEFVQGDVRDSAAVRRALWHPRCLSYGS